MRLQFLGGAREVGRSAVLVNDRLLLDYGMTAGTPPQWPVGPGRDGPAPEAVVVSHGHLDHVGGLPALLSGDDRPTIHWTPPTREFATTLARDTLELHGGTPQCPFTETEVHRLSEQSVEHGYGEPFEAAGHEVTLFDAGHIPGSAHVLVDDSAVRSTAGRASGRSPRADGETRLLYTGDFHTDEQRLVEASTARPDADVVVCESTYADASHDPREQVEARFAESARLTVQQGGTVVVPAFAIGRTQEVLLVCEAHDIDCYVDGMGQRVTRTLLSYPDYLRDAAALRRAAGRARFVTGRDGQRERIAAENTVVVTTAGMLTGGPAMTYVPAVAGNPTNTVAFSGYQVEGTPGRDLVETGSADIDGRRVPVAASVEQYDLSAHADRAGIRSFLADYRDATVLVDHGDACERFAQRLRDDGYDAAAPALGETVTV